MNTDELAKFFSFLLPFAHSLFLLCTTIRSEFRWSRQAKSEVGKLGRLYRFIIVFPLRVLNFLVIITLVVSAFGSIAAALLLSGYDLPGFMEDIVQYSFWILAVYIFLAFSVYFNLPSRILLSITKVLDFLRFDPGWVNAKWQLGHHKEFFAINIDTEKCERLASSIFHLIKKQKLPKLPEQAPEPEGLSKDELANYLLFGCAIESRIHLLFRTDKSKLADSWNYLAWVSRCPERPFKPEMLCKLEQSGASLYQALRRFGEQNNSNVRGYLPDENLIDTTVEKVLKQLVCNFRGRGSRLATTFIFHRKGSPKTLLRRLEMFDRYDSESIRYLFLKLSVRMKVWPNMVAGLFLYPYNYGIALLLLNSKCLLTANEIKTIDTDEEFRALVAKAEDRIVESIYEMVKSSSDSETSEFCCTVFDSKPKQVDRWKLSDYIDLWLFGHTYHYCKQRKTTRTGRTLGCPLNSETDPCYCDAAVHPWYLEEKLLRRSLSYG